MFENSGEGDSSLFDDGAHEQEELNGDDAAYYAALQAVGGDILPTHISDRAEPVDTPTHSTLPCQPFEVTNDYWRPSVGASLISRLTTLGADPEHSAALVVGAGTLPYTLDVLPPTIIVADIDGMVVDSVLTRCNFIANEAESWDDYREAFARDPSVRIEFWHLHQAGLVRDFEQAKLAAQRATLIPLIGDVVTKAPGIVEDDRMTGKSFTFMNVTNIAQYLTSQNYPETVMNKGRAVLSDLIGRLPVHNEAIICDSSVGPEATLYTQEQYAAYR